MTIAAGFLCRDGLVLAADTRYSGVNKRDAAKLFWFHQGTNVVAMAGAGDATLIRRVQHEIGRVFSASMSEHAITRIVEGIVSAQLVQARKTDRTAECEVLLGIRTQADGLSLWENEGGSVLAPVAGKAQCIGCGQSLGLYFADWLFRPHMPFRYTRVIAAHLLKQTKRYVKYCGGQSHILMIPADSGMPYRLKREEIHELETQHQRIEDLIRKVLIFSPGIPGVDVNVETLAVRMGALAQAAQTATQTFKPIQQVSGAPMKDLYEVAQVDPTASASPSAAALEDDLEPPEDPASPIKPSGDLQSPPAKPKVRRSPKRGRKDRPPSRE